MVAHLKNDRVNSCHRGNTTMKIFLRENDMSVSQGGVVHVDDKCFSCQNSA